MTCLNKNNFISYENERKRRGYIKQNVSNELRTDTAYAIVSY